MNMRLISKNTKKNGEITIFTYKEGHQYICVCLELDIVKEGNDLESLKSEMLESAVGHVAAVCKDNLSDDLLNRHAPKEYWDRFDLFINSMKKKKTSHKRESVDTIPIREICLV